MDMDTMIYEGLEKQHKAMIGLLARYQHELNDFRSKTGVATGMSNEQIVAAEKNLEERIADLSEGIMSFEERYSYVL